MTITWEEIVVWLIVGALAGSVAGTLVKRKKEGFGKFKNLWIGLAGALVGGLIFKLFKIDLGLAKINVSLQDLIAALLGSLLLLLILWIVAKSKGKKAA